MLFVDKVVLNNFGAHIGKKEFDFVEGVNIISGKNGYGKSTISQAINMLLLDDYEGSYKDFINDNATEMSAEIYFKIDGVGYHEILVEGKTSSRELKDDNDKVLATGKDCKDYLAKLLDPVITSYAISFKQNGGDRITSVSDANRRELLKKLLEVDYTKKVKAKIDPLIKDIEAKAIEVDKEIYNLQNTVYNPLTIEELPFTERELTKKNTEIKLLEGKVSSIKQIQESNEHNTKLLEDAEKDLALDEEALKCCNIKLEQTEDELKNLPSIIEEKIATAETDIDKEIEEVKDSSVGKLKELQDQLIAAEKELERLNNIQFPLPKRVALKDFVSLRRPIVDKLSEVNGKVVSLSNSVHSLEKGVCPVCGGDCQGKHDEYQLRLDEELEIQKSINEQLDSLQKEEVETNKKIEENNKIKTDKASHEVEVEKAKNNLDSIKAKIELINTTTESAIASELSNKQIKVASIRENFKVREEELTKSIRATKLSISDYNSRIERAKQNIESIKQHIQDISFDNLVEFNQEIESLQSEVDSYNSIKASNEKAVEYNKALEETKKINQTKEQELLATKVKLSNEKAEWELTSEILLKKYPIWRVTNGTKELEDAMNLFINEVYDKDLNVSFNPLRNVLKLEYGKGERKLPVHRLSGMEKTLVDLSFINIFNQKLNLGFITLDEVDAASDKDNKMRLFESISSMSKQYPQMLVISHSDDIKNYLITNCKASIINL